MKRSCVVKPKIGQRPVKASNEVATRKAKKIVYEKLQAAFDAIDGYYDVLKGEYGKELDAIYDELEILVRELEMDI